MTLASGSPDRTIVFVGGPGCGYKQRLGGVTLLLPPLSRLFSLNVELHDLNGIKKINMLSSFHLDLSFFILFFYPVRDEVVQSETVGEAVHLPRVLRVVYLWKLEG